MRPISRSCATALAAGAFLVPVSAQLRVINAADQERRSSSVLMFDRSGQGVAAGVSISFTAPEWKEEYDDFDGMLEKHKLKGQNARLGKNWWTTLDTTIALEIAGTKVAPGAYHLGLHCDSDGNFHLLVLDAGKSTKNGWLPFIPAAWKPDYKVPLELKKDALAQSSVKMQIEIKADPDNPSAGAFAIRWGKHELSAPVKLQVPTAKAKDAKDASGGKVEPEKK